MQLSLIACSGPGAASTIRVNVAYAQICAEVGAFITLALIYDGIRHHQWGKAWWAAALLMLIHPAWTVSAYDGDCGYTLYDAAFMVLTAHGVLLLGHVLAGVGWQRIFARIFTRKA